MEHFGRKVELDGITFDSKKEAQFYQQFVKPSSKRFTCHENFDLVSKFSVGGYTQRGIFYRPDFVIYGPDGREHVYDVKTSLSAQGIDKSAMLRFKLFAKRYGMPVEVVVPRRNDFKMKLFGFTTTDIQSPHQRKKRNGQVVIDHYDVFSNIDYDIRKIIGN